MPEWYVEYVKFIEEMRTRKFKWGSDDCGKAWFGRLVEIVTGEENPLIVLEDYSNMTGAIREMRRLGYSNLKDMTSGLLNKEPEHPSKADIGDVALIKDGSPFGYAYGIVNGDRVFFRSKSGIGTKDLLEVECIYKL